MLLALILVLLKIGAGIVPIFVVIYAARLKRNENGKFQKRANWTMIGAVCAGLLASAIASFEAGKDIISARDTDAKYLRTQRALTKLNSSAQSVYDNAAKTLNLQQTVMDLQNQALSRLNQLGRPLDQIDVYCDILYPVGNSDLDRYVHRIQKLAENEQRKVRSLSSTSKRILKRDVLEVDGEPHQISPHTIDSPFAPKLGTETVAYRALVQGALYLEFGARNIIKSNNTTGDTLDFYSHSRDPHSIKETYTVMPNGQIFQSIYLTGLAPNKQYSSIASVFDLEGQAVKLILTNIDANAHYSPILQHITISFGKTKVAALSLYTPDVEPSVEGGRYYIYRHDIKVGEIYGLHAQKSTQGGYIAYPRPTLPRQFENTR